MPPLQPMPLAVARAAFSHPDWIFELKWDGFRSLAYIDSGRCRLVPRKSAHLKKIQAFTERAHDTHARSGVRQVRVPTNCPIRE